MFDPWKMTDGVKNRMKKTMRSSQRAFVFGEDSSALKVIILLKEINIDLWSVAVLSLTQPIPLKRQTMKKKKKKL